MKHITKFCLIGMILLSVPAIAVAGGHKPKKDLIGVAVGNEAFSTLVKAIKAAGLVSPLKSKGPFTVFAPTDKAFAALPEGTLKALLKPENKRKLEAILKHHVLPDAVFSKSIVGKKLEPKTLNGTTLKIDATADITVSGSRVVTTDIKARNGVIHVIDKVLLP